MAPQLVSAKLRPQRIGGIVLFVKGADNKRKGLGGDGSYRRGVLLSMICLAELGKIRCDSAKPAGLLGSVRDKDYLLIQLAIYCIQEFPLFYYVRLNCHRFRYSDTTRKKLIPKLFACSKPSCTM